MTKPFHCVKPIANSKSLSYQADPLCIGKRLLIQFHFTYNFWNLMPSFPFISLRKAVFLFMFFEHEFKALSYFI